MNTQTNTQTSSTTDSSKESVPKPKAYLSLNYPTVPYKKLEVKRPYIFDVSTNATVKKLPKNWLKVAYPSLKASIDITYRPVNNNLISIISRLKYNIL